MPFNKLFNYKDPQLDEELRRLIQELALQPAWIAPTLQNSWVNFDATHNSAGYYKDQFGVVYLKGLIKNGVVVPGTVLFTLPLGYRPKNVCVIIVPSNEAYGRINIDPTGGVSVVVGSAAWLSLDNISFRTV